MSLRAAGPFDVSLQRHPPYDAAPGATLARATVSKVFHGELTATSTVEMLSAMSEVTGSAAYVAIERVTGTLGGKAGSFVLHHTGLMRRGASELTIGVVPDSGTGELRGLTGSMKIDITEGKHFYTFDYAITAD